MRVQLRCLAARPRAQGARQARKAPGDGLLVAHPFLQNKTLPEERRRPFPVTPVHRHLAQAMQYFSLAVNVTNRANKVKALNIQGLSPREVVLASSQFSEVASGHGSVAPVAQFLFDGKALFEEG